MDLSNNITTDFYYNDLLCCPSSLQFNRFSDLSCSLRLEGKGPEAFKAQRPGHEGPCGHVEGVLSL